MSDSEYKKIADAQNSLPHFHQAEGRTQEKQLVYQYRNFDSFWSIIKSDSFWATNARFSNDEVEQKFGMEVISAICSGNSDLKKTENLGLDENFIVCFCQDDDKLSQWRGYAPKGGVALGFDFGMPRAFTVSSSNSSTKACDVLQYVGIDKVVYIAPQGDTSDKDYKQNCEDKLNLVKSPTAVDDLEVLQREIQKKAPYIKHDGFYEEEEYRLVFRNQEGTLNQCILYREANDGALQYPYVIVKCRLPQDPRTSAVRVCVKEKEAELTHNLESALKAAHPSLVHTCRLTKGTKPDANEPFCTGCVLRRWENPNCVQRCRSSAPPSDGDYEYFLHNDENCVIITQGENQEEVFEIVHKEVQNCCTGDNKVSVWCEGHLPVRTITVGPCANQSNMVEAIRHYCKHTYWLRDVQIFASKIPFRTQL